ncbi:DNA recombination protein RmuC [Sandaracinobacter sp. RS1-74]|uniref:DNA recombination protein RmuC n=1 Tax=Sandaracinobacteroides sayramensis TaxID=2913411 RepID=UPI001EDB93FF|nr:DNA recombination protein RmuC [Sandaracinobacteroides sayramensis]MCG2842781.1 DNA recombination protein RmuC [Sandaracinobacteroides sayramensis]
MSPELVIALVILLSLLVAMAAGWAIWGKPLASSRNELAERREALGRAVAEVASFKAQAEEARPFMGRAAELQAALAAAESSAAERDRAHHLALAERDRVQTEALTERDRVHARQLEEMRGEFQRLAAEALERAQKQFTEQAAETLKLHRAEAAKGLTDSREALASLVTPMKETLARYGDELKALETKREQAYGSLSEQLQSVALGQQAVKAEANKIVAALRSSSRASGAWGEAQLRNVLEMAGLREGIDFELQASTTDTEGQRRRPDAVLKLPGGRELVVDSKCSLADYLAASEAEGEAERLSALKRHAFSVRNHAKGLSEKAYWKEFAQSADFVVMFLPGENFLSAALEQDLDLLAWALDQRILLAGPTNLLAIARVVAMVWRQEKMADEARAIGELGADLYASLATMTEHVGRVGRNLGEATGAYNDFIASLEARVLTKARKFPEMGVDKGKKPIPELAPVEKALRLVQAPEMQRLDGKG